MRLVSASSDKTIKIWEFPENLSTPRELTTLDQKNGGHSEWVRDVCWSPMLSEDQLIASCGEVIKLLKTVDFQLDIFSNLPK